MVISRTGTPQRRTALPFLYEYLLICPAREGVPDLWHVLQSQYSTVEPVTVPVERTLAQLLESHCVLYRSTNYLLTNHALIGPSVAALIMLCRFNLIYSFYCTL